MMLIPLLVLSLLLTYFEYALAWVFPKDGILFWGFSIFLLIPFLAQLWMLLVYFRSEESDTLLFENALKRLAFFSMALVSFLLSLLLVRDFVRLILSFLSDPFPALRSPSASFIIVGMSFALLALGFFRARFVLALPDVEVPIPNLHPDLENFRIVQLSDVHFGTGPELPQVQKIMSQALALKPDLIALTGDIIDGATSSMKGELLELARLNAPFGVFFVMGNHEYYWNGANARQAIQNAGIRVLLNDSVLIQKGNAKIQLAGMDDLASKHFGGLGAIPPAIDSTAQVRIILAHQPQTAPKSESAGYDLQLSGHTHAGQFFPWNYIIKFVYPVSQGLGKIKGMFLYVNQGTGYWGPPVRLGTKCEITTLRLVRKASGN